MPIKRNPAPSIDGLDFNGKLASFRVPFLNVRGVKRRDKLFDENGYPLVQCQPRIASGFFIDAYVPKAKVPWDFNTSVFKP